jgi:hypothetical protein
MTVSRVRVEGIEPIVEMLGALPAEVRKAARTSLNRQATATRKVDIVEALMAGTGIQRKVLNDRLPISRANRELIAIIKADPAGIPVPAYMGWRYQPTGRHPTRHRIIVRWPGAGTKIAAGFVNPFGTYKAPISTRLYAYRGDTSKYVALAPSAASLRKYVYANSEMEVTGEQLARRFHDFLFDIVRRRPVPDEP